MGVSMRAKKKGLSRLLLLVVALFFLGVFGKNSFGSDSFRLHIFYTNDLAGNIEPCK